MLYGLRNYRPLFWPCCLELAVLFRTMQVPSAQPNEGSAATTSHPGWMPRREIPVPLEPAWLSVSRRALSDVIGWVWAPRFHTFFFFALFQGSPLKREPCSRSQRFPPRSDPGPCRTAQQAAGGDRTCPDSAASSRDSPSSSARPARRVLPGQGKLLYVCISQNCHEHRLILTRWWAPCWAGQELGKGSAEPSWGSHISAGPLWGLFAGPLKRKTPLEKMPWLCLVRAGDTKALWAFCPGESKAKEALSC